MIALYLKHRKPKLNLGEKIEYNRQRDRKVIYDLTQSGWKMLIIWEWTIRGKHRLYDLMLSKSIESSCTLMKTMQKLVL